MSVQPIPVWLDCDPGHDDAFAILLAAHHPMVNLLGISTVFGNASLEKTTYNATSLLTAIGKHDQVTVYPGAAKARSRPPVHSPTDIHGESGIDGTNLLPKPLRGPDRSVSAVDAMAKALLAQPAGSPWIVATGCLTNVAEAVEKYPQLADHVAGLSFMGGAVGGGFTKAVSGQVDGIERIGNRTPWAEFNIFIDPEAADFILSNDVLARKSTMIPLDVTHLVLATKEVQNRLLHGDGGPVEPEAKGRTTLRVMLVELLNFFAETYRTAFGITEGPPLHDPVAAAIVLQTLPKEYKIQFHDFDIGRDGGKRHERFSIKVVTEGTYEDAYAGAQTGRTIATLLPEGAPGVAIPRGLDIAKFWTVIEECIERADETNAKSSAGGPGA